MRHEDTLIISLLLSKQLPAKNPNNKLRNKAPWPMQISLRQEGSVTQGFHAPLHRRPESHVSQSSLGVCFTGLPPGTWPQRTLSNRGQYNQFLIMDPATHAIICMRCVWHSIFYIYWLCVCSRSTHPHAEVWDSMLHPLQQAARVGSQARLFFPDSTLSSTA